MNRAPVEITKSVKLSLNQTPIAPFATGFLYAGGGEAPSQAKLIWASQPSTQQAHLKKLDNITRSFVRP